MLTRHRKRQEGLWAAAKARLQDLGYVFVPPRERHCGPDYLTAGSACWWRPLNNRRSGCTICVTARHAGTGRNHRSEVVQAMPKHASIVLTVDAYVAVLPQVARQPARETARLVLSTASALGRPLSA